MLGRTRLGRLRGDERGSASVEAVVILPLLLWVYAAASGIFVGFQERDLSQKAAYTVADMFSRHSAAVTDTEIDSAKSLFDYLIEPNEPTSLRVSSLGWDPDLEAYEVLWSQTRGAHFDALATQDVSDWEDRLPDIVTGDGVILVETHTRFDPIMKIGMGEIDIDTFIFTRPRFVPRLGYTE